MKNIKELIAKWRREACECDIQGIMTSITGAGYEQDKADLLNKCANELEKCLKEIK
jgi:endonuclease III-like uncharacterized protein